MTKLDKFFKYVSNISDNLIALIELGATYDSTPNGDNELLEFVYKGHRAIVPMQDMFTGRVELPLSSAKFTAADLDTEAGQKKLRELLEKHREDVKRVSAAPWTAGPDADKYRKIFSEQVPPSGTT